MQPPKLPWEVIERVITHSGDHLKTLRNVSLVCHELRPHTLCVMVAHVKFKTRGAVFDFCDFLKAKPHLKPFVRSITLDPRDFVPFPLLHILPHLPELILASPKPADLIYVPPPVRAILNRSSLTYCQQSNTRIQTLSLFKIFFATYLEFAQLLLAFSTIENLVCTDVVIMTEGNQAPLDSIKRRMSKRLQLRTIHIDYSDTFRNGYYDTASIGALLLNSGVIESTIQSLSVTLYKSYQLSQSFDWPRLRSLVLKLVFKPQDITDSIVLLEEFHRPTLKEVAMELQDVSILSINRELARSTGSGLYRALEQSLLRFSHPRITWFVQDPVQASRMSFWTQELGKHFPALFRRGEVALRSGTVNHIGHDGPIITLRASPDSKWVASGSSDSTIVLWDTNEGVIVKQWVAHGYTAVRSLAFSPDSRFLVSGGADWKAIVWDISEGPQEVAALEGHAGDVGECEWSPCGDIIASGSNDTTVRLWDARTFQQLRVLRNARAGVCFLKFSPDGRWLISGCGHYKYHFWNVASGTLHSACMMGDSYWHKTRIFASAFDPESTRIVISLAFGKTKVLDIETGAELLVLRVPYADPNWAVRNLAFSPDGRLVLVAFTLGTMSVFDTYSGVQLFSLIGHSTWAGMGCFSPCGRYIVSLSLGDGALRLWRTTDGSCMASEHLDRQVVDGTLHFSADGRTLAYGTSDGTVIIRRMCDIIPVDEDEAST